MGLVERYNNKNILVQVRTKSLFNFTPIKDESFEQLRKLYDSLSGHIKALETLGQSQSQWASLLLRLITTIRLLITVIRYKYTMSMGNRIVQSSRCTR